MSLLLLAVALSMDAFAAALSQGVSARSGATARTALIVGLAFGTAQGLMPLIGWGLGKVFTSVVRDVDHWIAFVLLVLLGVHMIRQGFSTGDHGSSGNGQAATGVALFAAAIATSIDAAVAGATFGSLGYGVAIACTAIGVTTFVLSGAAVFLGRAAGDALGPRAKIGGGVVLVALAFKIVITHVWFGA